MKFKLFLSATIMGALTIQICNSTSNYESNIPSLCSNIEKGYVPIITPQRLTPGTRVGVYLHRPFRAPLFVVGTYVSRTKDRSRHKIKVDNNAIYSFVGEPIFIENDENNQKS